MGKKRKRPGGNFGPAANSEKTGQRAVDAFYTKPSVAKGCVRNLLEHIGDGPIEFVEPSAGSGAFVDALLGSGGFKGAGRDVVAMDIQDSSHLRVGRRDFFEWDPPSGADVPRCVFGNPPFGKNASTAVKFFNRAAELAQVVAFIVPRSFLKPGMENKLDRRFEKVEQLDVPPASFEFEGKDRDVPTVWQVWKLLPGDKIRPKRSTKIDLGRVEFGNPGWDETDMMIQRVGQRAGQVYWNKEDWEPYETSRNYHWVRIVDLAPEEKARLCSRSPGFEEISAKYDTAGMPSLSRGEIAKHINAILKEK